MIYKHCVEGCKVSIKVGKGSMKVGQDRIKVGKKW